MTAPQGNTPAHTSESDAPMCARCNARYAATEDSLCASCRRDVNLVFKVYLEYGDLPGGDE